MTVALLTLLVALADTTRPAEPLPDPARQVVTRAEIEAAGLYRLPDLWRLIDGVRTATVDGFAWRAGFGHGDPFWGETWTLLIDGERIEMGLFGEQNLSLVPVAITQVDSVEVWTVPRLVAGAFAQGGTLHIWTNRTQLGAAARGGLAIGNEIGDPGPFRYVPALTSRNVDKFGADYEALVSFGTERLRVQARFKRPTFYATDFAVFDRNLEALGANPATRSLRLFAPAIRVEADALGGTHTLSVLGGGGNDLWFFQPFGREIPVDHRWVQAGWHGRVPVAPGTTVGYRFAVAERRVEEQDDTVLGLDPRWKRRTLRAGFDGQRRLGAWTASLGGEVRRVTADGAEGFTLGTATGQLGRAALGSEQHLNLAISVASEAAFSAVAGTRHTVGGWTLGATAALAQRLPEETDRFSFWQGRGYAAFDAAVDVQRSDAPSMTTEALLRIDAARRLRPSLTVAANVTLRHTDGLTLETQPAAPDPNALAALRLLVVEPEATGQTVSGRAAVRWTEGGRRARLFYDGQAVVGGDDAFERAWRAVPRHRAGVDAALTLESFTLFSSLAWRSAARWPAYDALTGANGGLYDATVPAAWLLDASVEKWLWRRRVRGSVLFRNLLNQRERYHPVGAALDLRFYARLEVNL